MNFFIPAAAVHWGDNPDRVGFGAIEGLFYKLASDKVALIVVFNVVAFFVSRPLGTD